MQGSNFNTNIGKCYYKEVQISEDKTNLDKIIAK